MKTSLSVLGIQARQTLNQIKVTWEAVVRRGKVPARVQFFEEYRETCGQDESGMTEETAREKGELCLFAVQEAVLRGERLEKEIPQPNGEEHKTPNPRAMQTGEKDPQGVCPAAERKSARLMRVRRLTQGKSRRTVSVASSIFARLGQAERTGQKQRYRRSSLSPPPG